MYDYFLHTFKSFARVRPCVQVRARVCVCVERGEKNKRKREREGEGKGEGEREREREGGREGGEGGGKEIERERENVLERACGWVLLVEIQQVSEILLQDFWKVHACCRDNIFALLEGVSLFKVPYRSPQEITYV